VTDEVVGVFVTREHVRHNKSGIAHRGRTGINHLRELPTKLYRKAADGWVCRNWDHSDKSASHPGALQSSNRTIP
jgi:hypothetical protein